MRIITINREFGSGGREVGKRLADALGFAYFDTEIVEAIAERSKVDPEYVHEVLERGVFNDISLTFAHSFTYAPHHHKSFAIMESQNEIVKELAAQGDCIIVGKNADTILKKEKPLKLFIHADMEYKIKRCMARAEEGEQLTEKQTKRKIKQIERARASDHSYYSEIRWGDKRGYDLCINTTGLEIKSVIPAIAEFAKAWFEKSHETEE